MTSQSLYNISHTEALMHDFPVALSVYTALWGCELVSVFFRLVFTRSHLWSVSAVISITAEWMTWRTGCYCPCIIFFSYRTGFFFCWLVFSTWKGLVSVHVRKYLTWCRSINADKNKKYLPKDLTSHNRIQTASLKLGMTDSWQDAQGSETGQEPSHLISFWDDHELAHTQCEPSSRAVFTFGKRLTRVPLGIANLWVLTAIEVNKCSIYQKYLTPERFINYLTSKNISSGYCLKCINLVF